eukprot:TRINITY_DN2261_c0_g1_i4.p1 TRINITY_DN2261_c0_g1~~TRINITY_DN2261_c0_g1_i4.p1  ORF type:complete len:228 (+),score=64.54 TRINITY_DN2261_c0_g1_i4:821-1504(+)
MSLASKISHLIIAGEIMQTSKRLRVIAEASIASKRKMEEAAEARTSLKSGLRELDTILAELCLSMNVIIVPGSTDPTTFSWPQAPLHKSLLPSAAKRPSFYSFTNPASFNLDGFNIITTSGDNVNDLRKFADIPSATEAMEYTLKARHLAPTAPDTMACLPFAEDDPFVLEHLPNLYIAGDRFSSAVSSRKVSEDCTVVAVPNFSISGQVALIELPSMDVTQIQILT